jgi:hypothetical protein
MEVDSETTHAQGVTQEMIAEARLINLTGHTLSELQEAETTHAQGVTQEMLAEARLINLTGHTLSELQEAERENIVAQNFMVAETHTTQAEQPNNVSSMSSAQLVTSHEQNATGQVQQTSAVRQQRNIVTQSQTSSEGLGFDIIGITELPDDCLIVYPSMSGKLVNVPLYVADHGKNGVNLKIPHPCSPSYAYHRLGWIRIVLFTGVNIELRSTRS